MYLKLINHAHQIVGPVKEPPSGSTSRASGSPPDLENQGPTNDSQTVETARRPKSVSYELGLRAEALSRLSQGRRIPPRGALPARRENPSPQSEEHEALNFRPIRYSPTDSITQTKDAKPNRPTLTTVSLNIELPFIRERDGHICKPTALANIDHYWANIMGVANIPLRKNNKGFYNSKDFNQHLQPFPAETSVRQLAKETGSLQGEILGINDFQTVAEKMGYSLKLFNPENKEVFGEIIKENLSNKTPMITFFEVNTSGNNEGLPNNLYLGREHACVIVGLEEKMDRTKVSIAHWGSVYENIPILWLHNSMKCLPNTREPEIYKKNEYFPEQSNAKYSLANDSESATRTSKTPEPNSGYKNSLIVLKPDLAHERWKKRASSPGSG